MEITVVIATNNPYRPRLKQVLDALDAQTLSRSRWSLVVVDNASDPPLNIQLPSIDLTVVREPRLGLAWARVRGIREASGELLVLVDDDNVLDADYLLHVQRIATENPALGAMGGKCLPLWEGGGEPATWVLSFKRNLALRDLGEATKIQFANDIVGYPEFAPLGAGMVLRRAAAVAWSGSLGAQNPITDRRGSDLTSGGDCDMVMHAVGMGYGVGYFPELVVKHLIPDERLEIRYQAKLNFGIQRSWVQLLHKHSISPWQAILPCTLPLRKARAYLRLAAWRNCEAYVHWRGVCGRFEGQADLWRNHYRRKLFFDGSPRA